MVTLYRKEDFCRMTLLYMCVWCMWCCVVQYMCMMFVHSCKWLALFSHSLTIFLSPYYMATTLKRYFGSQTPFSCDRSTNGFPFLNTRLSVQSSQDPHPCLCPQKRAVLCSIVPCIVFDSLSPLALAQLNKVVLVLVCRNPSLCLAGL